MEENPSFVVPSDTEKLSHKYILDSIQRRRAEQAATELESTAEVLGPHIEISPGPVVREESPPPYVPLSLPPDKKYFRIAKVAELVGVEAHVLRYWETEFPMIKPSKSGGQRVYRRKDVTTLHLIRHLLHVAGNSIKVARKKVYEFRRTQTLPIPPVEVVPVPVVEVKVEPAVPTPEIVVEQVRVEQVLVRDTVLLESLAEELRELIRIAEA